MVIFNISRNSDSRSSGGSGIIRMTIRVGRMITVVPMTFGISQNIPWVV